MEHRGDGGGSRWAQVSAQLGLEEGGSLGSGFVLLDFWEVGVFSRHDIKQAPVIVKPVPRAFLCLLLDICNLVLPEPRFLFSFQGWVTSFTKPRTIPNSLLPSTTGLSPYFSMGCLSVRTFFYRLSNIYAQVSK